MWPLPKKFNCVATDIEHWFKTAIRLIIFHMPDIMMDRCVHPCCPLRGASGEHSCSHVIGQPTATTSIPRCRSLCCVSTLQRGSSSLSGLLLYLSYLPGLNSSVRRSRRNDQPGTHACLDTPVGNYCRLGITALDCCLPAYIIFVLQLVIIFIKYNTKIQAEEFVTRGVSSEILNPCCVQNYLYLLGITLFCNI